MHHHYRHVAIAALRHHVAHVHLIDGDVPARAEVAQLTLRLFDLFATDEEAALCLQHQGRVRRLNVLECLCPDVDGRAEHAREGDPQRGSTLGTTSRMAGFSTRISSLDQGSELAARRLLAYSFRNRRRCRPSIRRFRQALVATLLVRAGMTTPFGSSSHVAYVSSALRLQSPERRVDGFELRSTRRHQPGSARRAGVATPRQPNCALRAARWGVSASASRDICAAPWTDYVRARPRHAGAVAVHRGAGRQGPDAWP